jgi:hypothetical protein
MYFCFCHCSWSCFLKPCMTLHLPIILHWLDVGIHISIAWRTTRLLVTHRKFSLAKIILIRVSKTLLMVIRSGRVVVIDQLFIYSFRMQTVMQYATSLVDKNTTPRMPWHDVSIGVVSGFLTQTMM